MIKNEEGSMVVESVGLILKLLIISVVFFQLSMYVITVARLNLAVSEIVNRASVQGYISNSDITGILKDKNIKPRLVKVNRSIPDIGERANNLGDSISLDVSMRYTVAFSSLWNYRTDIHCKKQGVNQGYYGDGYVEY